MKNKSLIFSIFLVFIIVFSVSAISAQDVDNAISTSEETVIGDTEQVSGTVSGDVDVATENPWSTSGELSYDIPSDAKTIKSADVYVNVYGGSAKNTYGANANVSISTANGNESYSESLWSEDGSSDGTVYTVNNHTTKCYSDYMIHYDVTNLLNGLNGTNLKIKVDTFKMENKSFDGRIKLIGLVLAYDDGDNDIINYWVNDNQIWTNSNTTLIFDTSALANVLDMSLTNIALSSQDATYLVNGEFLTDAEHKSGNYYQYNKWDIADYFNSSKKTEFTAIGTAGSYGVSYKNVLSVLTAKPGAVRASVSLASERKNSNLDIVYPATFNQFTINVNTNKNGKYVIKLLADGNVVNSTEVYINSSSEKITLIDETIRPADNTTVSTGASGSYNKVNYTAQLFLKDELLNESSINAAILYNGYLPKEYAYPNNGLKSFLNVTISGDIVIDVAGAYASGTANRVDTWNVTLSDDSTIVKAFVYAPYCYGGADDENLYNVTFNGVKPSVVSFSRDQANIVSTSGYGLIVYDVTDSIKTGENTFVLNKTHSTGAYPSILIYLYNTTGSTIIKNAYIYNGADLVGMTGNGANRPISVDSVLKVDSSDVASAVAYIFGAGAKDDRASIVVNGEKDDDAWNTTLSDQINIYAKDISKTVKDNNEISIILNNNMFTALQQVVVLTKKETPVVVKNETQITAPTVTKVYNVAKNLVVTLKDKNNKKAISGAKVTINLNGKNYVRTTNAKGQASVAIPNLAPKNSYAVTVRFAGNDDYKASTLKTKVVVKKATPKMTAKTKVTYKVKTKIKNYAIVLKNNKNQAMKKVKVTLKVKGKTYRATTNAKGKAIFKITKLTKIGKYTAKVNFAGNKYYNALTKTVKITVKK